ESYREAPESWAIRESRPGLSPWQSSVPPHRFTAGRKARILYRQQTWSGESTRASSLIPSSLTVGREARCQAQLRLECSSGEILSLFGEKAKWDCGIIPASLAVRN